MRNLIKLYDINIHYAKNLNDNLLFSLKKKTMHKAMHKTKCVKPNNIRIRGINAVLINTMQYYVYHNRIPKYNKDKRK